MNELFPRNIISRSGTASNIMDRRNHKDKKENNNNILSSSIEKKINSVNREIDGMKTDELLLNVDPEIEGIEVIEQIQNYYALIKKEMHKIVKILKL